MTSPSDNVDKLAIWDVVRNRSQSSRCVSLSSFSGSLDNSHSVEMNQSCQYNKTFVCCNAWCVTLRQKRNTASLHMQYFYATNNLMCWNTHTGRGHVVHTHASTLPTLPIVWLQCTSLALWFPMCEKGKVIFKRKFLFRKMSHAFLLFQPAHFVIKNVDYLRVSGWIQYFNMQSLIADYHHKCS